MRPDEDELLGRVVVLLEELALGRVVLDGLVELLTVGLVVVEGLVAVVVEGRVVVDGRLVVVAGLVVRPWVLTLAPVPLLLLPLLGAR